MTTVSNTAYSVLIAAAVAIGVLFIAAGVGKYQPASPMVFSNEELWVYNVNNSEGIRYLGIMGEVFDVSSGSFYSMEGGYDFFVGLDGSRAFITGDFQKDLNDNVGDFDAGQCKGLVDWRNFYRDHQDYKYVGKVRGAFFDTNGQPLQLLNEVERKAALAEEWQKQKQQLEKDVPNCSKRWTAKVGSEVWCQEGQYPRLVKEKYGEDQERERCACFDRPGWSDTRKLYKDCNPTSSRCNLSRNPQ